MGHNFYAYADANFTTEIARMQRPAGTEEAHAFYEALQATEHRGESGGTVTSQRFAVDALMEAMMRLPKTEKFDQEKEFLAACVVENIDGGVWIQFT